MIDPIVHLNYPLPIEKLLFEAEEVKKSAKPYTDDRYPDQSKNDWLIGHHSSSTIDSIMDNFNIEGKARFYWLEPYAEIPEHVDNGTKCSLNFILSKDPAPILIDNVEYTYKQALLDTTVSHSVRNGDTERLLLKISIFHKSFFQVLRNIPDAYKRR